MLLPTAVDQRFQLYAITHPKRANAFRAVDLVRRNRDHIRPVRDWHSAIGLHGVAEEQASVSVRYSREIGHRLDCTDLIVDEHDSEQAGAH